MSRLSQTASSPSPAVPPYGSEEDLAVQRTIVGRPYVSIKARIATVFIFLFVLMGSVTAVAVMTLSDLRERLQLVDDVGSYAFEVQQARRYEKDFFLYGTNLADAIASIQTARGRLESSAEAMRSVLGRDPYTRMTTRVTRYEELLETLLARETSGPPAAGADVRKLEAELRVNGARMLADAQEMIDQERLNMYAGLQTATVSAIGFLVIMLFIMAFEATFIAGALLKPLARFMSYAARFAEGDYTLIRPARKYRDEFSDLAVAFNRMIIELKSRQDQLLHSRKMAAVGTLTSGIAHELNNPLNNIGLTAEALIESFDAYPTEKKLAMLQEINTQVERASGTVRNLLDFTRKEVPAFTAVSPGQVVEDALKLVRNELNLAGVEPVVKIVEHLPEVSGNPRNLQQVFLNLFLNSIQAMPTGGILTVSVRAEDGEVRFDVTDTGVGIPRENLDKIFDPFFTTKQLGQGTGLGLSVSFGVVEKHNGRITVASEVGKGTTFTIHLPARRATQEKV
jgi:two-component system, NtrC family, sensor kinase